VLIPLPGALEQRANAEALEREGGAVVLLQDGLSGKKLAEVIGGLLRDGERLERMGDGARKLGTAGAADRIIDELLAIKKK
jgi:UDP-N-acetylglucosamine--N-acetylmuramyl-(pentapeptide) pyrophosphoryl-undecaprenol N-acetylglucosamine transferase